MDINSQIIFDTLKKQNILKSELKYKELVNSKLNILIKKKVNGQWMYYVDLWQSFFNLNTKYFEENNRPEWIEDTLIDNQNGYSTEINDAAIYKNFKLFEEYFLLPNYEILIDDFFNKSKEENLENYGSESPISDCEQFKIVTLSDYQLKKELTKYKNEPYKNLADYYVKIYENIECIDLENKKEAINKIKHLEQKFTQDYRFKFMMNDSRIHDTIDQLIEIIDDNFQKLQKQKIKIPFPKEYEYSTKHLTKLY
jgi:hypothetical protein